MNEPPTPYHAQRRAFPVRRLLSGAAVAAVLVLVFVAYLRPDFALDLANRFIMCF